MTRAALLSVLLTVLSAPQPAHAQSPADVAAQWGLLGHWRHDCNAPPSRPGNVDLEYIVKGNQLVHVITFGNGTSQTAPITAAKIRADNSIDITVYFPARSATRQNVFQKTPDGRLRTLVSRDVNTDDYFVRDGKYTSNGKPFVLNSRCSDYRSGNGMNSLSPGTLAKRPSFQSVLAFSIRCSEEETKFHQM